MNKKRLYAIFSLAFVILTIVILAIIDKTNNINLSMWIQGILIVYLIKITYGCILYVKDQYVKQKYSYGIVLNLGLILFLGVNIFRQIVLLIVNYNKSTINDIYMATLQSFSYFALIVLPCIIILSVYSIITNIVLIKKEGFRPNNMLGIIFGIITIIGILASQNLYVIYENLSFSDNQKAIKYIIDLSLNSVLTYFYCLVIATLYTNIVAASHKPKYDKDFAIILGCQIKKDGTLTPLLKGRADKALEFGKLQEENNGKEIIYVPSGGQGFDEVISESEAIKNYLIQQGVPENRIIIENKSTSTKENMRFSKEKIDCIKKDGKIIFSTTNYHVFRSGVIANSEGIDCEGIGSKTKWYFYTNSLLREFFANLITQRGKHFVLITSVNLAIIVLVLIGYFYNLY